MSSFLLPLAIFFLGVFLFSGWRLWEYREQRLKAQAEIFAEEASTSEAEPKEEEVAAAPPNTQEDKKEEKENKPIKEHPLEHTIAPTDSDKNQLPDADASHKTKTEQPPHEKEEHGKNESHEKNKKKKSDFMRNWLLGDILDT